MKIKLRIVLCVCMLCLVPLMTDASTCVISDPLGHTDDTPIVGTYATAASSTLPSFDSRPLTLILADGWSLFLRYGISIIVF